LGENKLSKKDYNEKMCNYNIILKEGFLGSTIYKRTIEDIKKLKKYKRSSMWNDIYFTVLEININITKKNEEHIDIQDDINFRNKQNKIDLNKLETDYIFLVSSENIDDFEENKNKIFNNSFILKDLTILRKHLGNNIVEFKYGVDDE